MLRFCWVFALLMMLVTTPAAWAQSHKRSYEGPGNWFIGVDGGVSLALNENVTADNVMHVHVPSGSIQLGRTFTPRWSMRVTGGVSSQIGHPSKVAVQYKPKMFTDYHFYTAITTMDVMLNLSNCFRRYDTRNWFDGYLVVGGGGLFRFNVDEKVKYWYIDVYPVEYNNYWFWTAKVGFEGAWHISRTCDLTAEFDVFASDNAYNGVVGSPMFCDFFLSPRIGIVYYLGNRRHRHRFANPPVEHKYWTELNRE